MAFPLLHQLVLYGCETRYLTLREECGLRVFESRVLRILFGRKRDAVLVDSIKLHSTVFQNFPLGETKLN
jgi:hypothetical protein